VKVTSDGKLVAQSRGPKGVAGLLREHPGIKVGFSLVCHSSLRWILKLKEPHSIHVPIDAISYVDPSNFDVLLRTLRKSGLRIYL